LAAKVLFADEVRLTVISAAMAAEMKEVAKADKVMNFMLLIFLFFFKKSIKLHLWFSQEPLLYSISRT
jgi:hypothetical protein